MTGLRLQDIKPLKLLPWVVTVIIVATIGIYLWTHSSSSTTDTAQAVKSVMPANLKLAASTNGELPHDADFVKVAENDTLVLYADKNSGHFKVDDKRDGHEITSYPNPTDWQKEKISGTWRSHLLSPIMMETIDTSKKLEVMVSSLLSQKGGITSWKQIDNGFAVTFVLPTTNMIIPVEVRIQDDYVETKIIDTGIVEAGKDSLLSLKVYPFMGAAQPDGQEGYILLPDGSGAIYNIKDNMTNERSVYKEPIYGGDMAFTSALTNRRTVTMPIYGIKAKDNGILAVADQGDEYGYIYAAPSGVYSKYAWATIEQAYRLPYYQPTSNDGKTGFTTYSKVKFGENRSVRYYLLPKASSDYSGMAAKYRQYLMEVEGLKQLTTGNSSMPLYLDIIGGDSQKGFLQNKFITGTTTDQAKLILERLHAQGIPQVVVTYQGWQHGGVSTYGFGAQVDKRLGGNAGMKSFAEYAKSKGDKVLLEVNYQLNTDGKNFNPKSEALQDQAGTILKFKRRQSNDEVAQVSPQISLDRMKSNISKFKALGIDGLSVMGLGDYLDSDYNRRYHANRTKVKEIQKEFMNTIQTNLPTVSIGNGNAYALSNTSSIRRIPGDYSYDLFLDEAVPFSQIALHGIIPYTLNWGNSRDEYQKDFLRSIEYGAAPTFGVIYAKTEEMKKAYSVWQYSLNFDEWEASLLKEYQRFSEALGDVQDQFIRSNRTIARNVKETVYENGQKIIVNYNNEQISVDGYHVPGNDFIVVKGSVAQ
ncbi:DUF5696 domain-containing protein [Paenibacillus sp. FSL R10-2734]|uniref:DUF5696 domain-containing protein n=1 Tax=Paenibacillus sp. FSL R10-2734 TaxID=2954691 RepID=UPI0030D82662